MSSSLNPPFHVLFLPGGNICRDSQHGHNEALSSIFTRDDYLSRRHLFWEKTKASNHKLIKDGTEYPLIQRVPNDGGGEETLLRCVATPLELALVGCCERLSPDGWQSTQVKPVHRSRLHRPIRPSNYDADTDDEDNVEEEKPRVKKVKPEKSNLHKSGILLRGKECHFLSLLCMHCTANALGHRALALAILQRTVDWEASVHMQSTDALSNIIQRFLEAGGMKLLARWLVDSFTASKGTTSPTGSLLLPILQLLKSIPFIKEVVVASQIHKTIKRFKKAIDTLVDRLDPSQLNQKHTLTGGLSVGTVLSALDDLMSVWKQAAAADMTENNKEKVKSQHSPFGALQQELESRFDSLVTLQNEGGGPPEWLPKSISSIISGKTNLLASFKSATTTGTAGSSNDVSIQQNSTISRSSNQNWYEPLKKDPNEQTQTWAKLMSRKRKEQVALYTKRPTQIRKLNHHESSKKVSWADRPLIRSTTNAPLAEVRVFVKDMYDELDEETPHSNDLVNGNYESEQSPSVEREKETVSNCELDDLYEDPDLADMF